MSRTIQDIMAYRNSTMSDEMFEALIQEQVRLARIDELEHVLGDDMRDGVWVNFDPEINPISRTERIKELKNE